MNTHLKNAIKRMIPNTYIIRRIETNQKALLITFDDGPHKKITPQVLSLLDEYDARAVFFVVGKYANENKDLLLEIQNRKHLIANHTYDHPNRKITSYREYRQEVTKCQDVIHKITGKKPKYFRPPMGILSMQGLLTVSQLNLKTVLWSCAGYEWLREKAQCAEETTNHLLKTVNPKDIICLHDNHQTIPEILEKLLPVLKQRGYNLSLGINQLPK